jgi:hypothetical protein
MAINWETKYPDAANAADTDYPYGSPRNKTETEDGTPLDAEWVKDFAGFGQALLSEAGVDPSGEPDTATDSDLFNAMRALSVIPVTSIEGIPDLSGYADGQKFDITGYYSGTTVGGGTFVKVTGRHDGVIYFDPSRVSEIGTSAYYVDSGVDAVCAMRVDYKVATPEMAGASESDSSDAFEAAMLAAVDIGKFSTNLRSTVFDRPLYFINNELNNVEFDFNNCEISLTGARTEGTEFDWEYGAISIHGVDTGIYQDVTLTSDAEEGRPTWEVTDSSIFTEGDWIEIETTPSSDTFSDKIYWRLVQVTQIDSTTQIRVNHFRGYDVPSGTVVRYRIITPSENVSVKNWKCSYDRDYTGTSTDKEEASSGLAFRYVVNCHTEDTRYSNNPKQAVHFELSHGCSVKNSEMKDPVETSSGGYNTQFSRSLNWSVDNAQSDNDRHVFDATAASDGTVKNCGSYDTSNAGFTTHGTYEHDIEYDNNRGLFQIAGSGSSFGQSAKRIKCKNHRGGNLRLGQQTGSFAVSDVRDFTVEDSEFISLASVNMDGFQAIRTSFNGGLDSYQYSSESSRKNVLTDCHIAGYSALLISGVELHLVRTSIENPENLDLTADGELHLKDCPIASESASSVAETIGLSRLVIDGGSWDAMPMLFDDTTADQVLEIRNYPTMTQGLRTTLPLINMGKTSGSITVRVNGLQSESSIRHLTQVTDGAATYFYLDNWEMVGGTFRVDNVSSHVAYVHSNIVFNGCTPTLPVAGAKFSYGSELTI